MVPEMETVVEKVAEETTLLVIEWLKLQDDLMEPHLITTKKFPFW